MRLLFSILLSLSTWLVATGSTWAEGLCWFNYKIDGNQLAVFDIYRDSKGRNWIGSTSGLYLFDGYQTIAATYGEAPFHAQVYRMAEDGDRIFVAANDGLFVLDPETIRIQPIEGHFPREIRSMLLIDRTLWLGSLSGLYHYDLVTCELSGPVQQLPHRAVYSLIETHDGTVYIGTYDGLSAYSPLTGAYSEINLPHDSANGGNIFVNSLAEDRRTGTIYIGTEGALLTYSPADGKVNSIEGFEGNSVKSLTFCDDTLVGGTDNGLVLMPDKREPHIFRHDSRNAFSIASNVVWSVCADRLGNVWCGNESGISIIDYESPVRVYSLADITGRSEGQQVYSILRDRTGTLWIGGTNGVIMQRPDGSTRWFTPGNGSDNLSHNRVRDIAESSHGDILVAGDGGINIYDRAGSRFRNHRFADRSNHLNANWAYGVLEDSADSTLWIASYLGGVFKEKVSRFRSEGFRHTADTVFASTDGGLPNDLIGQIIQDRQHNKWVLHFRDSALTRISADGTSIDRIDIRTATGQEPTMLCMGPSGDIWCGFYGGVARIAPSGTVSDTIIRFPFGGADETVRAMAPVAREIWVATSSAVWAVNPATMTARVLPLPSKFYTAIYFDESRREVILGATDEIVTANPQRLLDKHDNESIILAGVREGRHRARIDFAASNKNYKVTLPSDNRDIEIDILPSYFSPSSYLHFCYSLDDSGQWQLIDEGDNRIRLTSLPPGRHTVRLAIAGAPATVRLLTIEVLRPWYQSNLALSLYALAFFGIITMIIREGRRRQRRHIEEMERTNILATVENRLFFLANIAHELKTPLSMIIGPLSKVRTGEDSSEAAADIDTAYDNALKLNSLIHQTVEINRMELRSDSLLIYSRIDVVEFCRDIFDNYRRSVEERTFVFNAETPHIYVRTDAVKLESLVSNLLSNAVKYTVTGSTIALSVALDGADYEISVSDDGIGIPEAEQVLVFQRLYRSPRTAASHEGTGIGLYLVREYARLLGGNVSVESRVDEGSTFRLRLPLNESADEAETQGADSVTSTSSDKRKRVLIVDDNRSIVSFLEDTLGKKYRCAVAANGKAGLTVAAGFRPDVIITDEMMPVMSGLEMSRRLKDNPALAHVPILLLTAKDAGDIHHESITSGIDAFMSKPFDVPTLMAKVEQLLMASDKSARNMRLDRLTEAPEEKTESASDRQLAAVTNVIENNLSNPDLNVDFVCKALDLQSKALYRLLKKYVGVSPVDYIRQMRLRKAAMLLEQKKFSVSEVMYMVGFSSPSYFAKCFSALFGCPPGQYPPPSAPNS